MENKEHPKKKLLPVAIYILKRLAETIYYKLNKSDHLRTNTRVVAISLKLHTVNYRAFTHFSSKCVLSIHKKMLKGKASKCNSKLWSSL